MVNDSWMERFCDSGALCIHDGNPRRPHALLTSGKHSNGFFNASKIIENPRLLEQACTALINRHWKIEIPDRIIGSAFGAITIAHEFGRNAGTKCGFTEPVIEEGEKNMPLKRFNVKKGDKVLVVEDVMTTGGTTNKTIATLEDLGAKVSPVIFVLVNRSGMTHLGNREILALIDNEMPSWNPRECPLCKKGSEAIRPKGNWKKLTADY